MICAPRGTKQGRVRRARARHSPIYTRTAHSRVLAHAAPRRLIQWLTTPKVTNRCRLGRYLSVRTQRACDIVSERRAAVRKPLCRSLSVVTCRRRRRRPCRSADRKNEQCSWCGPFRTNEHANERKDERTTRTKAGFVSRTPLETTNCNQNRIEQNRTEQNKTKQNKTKRVSLKAPLHEQTANKRTRFIPKRPFRNEPQNQHVLLGDPSEPAAHSNTHVSFENPSTGRAASYHVFHRVSHRGKLQPKSREPITTILQN